MTRQFPDSLRSDSARWWRLYVGARRHPAREPLGALAAWAGDQYLLGRHQSALTRLRGLARRGLLRGGRPYKSGTRFVSDLDGFLRRLDYANRTARRSA